MKINKKRLLISVLVLFVALGCVICYVMFFKNKPKEEKEELGIESITTIDNINIKIGDQFYVKDDGEKLVIYDYDSNVLNEYTEDYSYYEIFDKRLIIITSKIGKKIINKNGDVLAVGSSIKVAADNKYILLDNAIYDYNMNKVYVLDFTGEFEYTAEFGNDLLIIQSYKKGSKSLIVDLKEKKILWSDFYNSSSYRNDNGITYIRFTKDNKGYLFDVNTKQILYENITYKDETYMDYNTFIYEDNIMYLENGIVYGENTKIDDKYIMNKDTCEKGYKLKDNKNNIVVDKCMYVYKALFTNAILGFDEENYILFYKNKEINGGYISLEGEYIKVSESYDLLGDGSTYTYYDKSLKQIDIDKNVNINYLNDGFYSSYDYNNYKSYILDKNLNKIENDLSSVICKSNGYCDVAKTFNEHYLYKNAKKVVDDTFVNININDNEIILETLYKTYIIKLGKSKINKLDLSFDNDIDIDKIVNEYELNNIKTKINNNKELFKKYAYIVEKNDMLLNYKKDVYDLFEVIVDKDKYFNEFYFLHKLGYLNIHESESLLSGKAAGTYQDFNTRIDLVSDSKSVLYHELLHFIDNSIDEYSSTTLYRCKDEIGVFDAIPNIPDGCDYVSIPYTNYITEAGAELFASKYFTKNVNAYNFGTYYLSALEYIYGSESLDKWYFEDNNYFTEVLYKEFNDEEIVSKILEALNDTTSLDIKYKDTGYLLDILIDLYRKHNKEDYLTDKKFMFLLKPMLGYDNAKESKYYQDLDSLDNLESNIMGSLKNELKYEYYNTYLVPININGKMYLSWYAWNNSIAKTATILIDYDFDNGNVRDYKIVEENY